MGAHSFLGWAFLKASAAIHGPYETTVSVRYGTRTFLPLVFPASLSSSVPSSFFGRADMASFHSWLAVKRGGGEGDTEIV